MAIATPGNSLPNRLMRMTGQYFDPGNLKLLSYLCWLVGIADLCRIYGYVDDMMSSTILQILQSQQSGVYNDIYSDTFSYTVTHLSGSSRIFEPPLHWSPSRHCASLGATGGKLIPGWVLPITVGLIATPILGSNSAVTYRGASVDQHPAVFFFWDFLGFLSLEFLRLQCYPWKKNITDMSETVNSRFPKKITGHFLIYQLLWSFGNLPKTPAFELVVWESYLGWLLMK